MAEDRFSIEEEKAWAEQLAKLALGAMTKATCDRIVMGVINKHGKPVMMAVLPARPEPQ